MLSESPAEETQTSGAIVAAVSRDIVRLYARLHGRGPTRARTHLHSDHVACVLEHVFTRSERVLIEAGRGAQVADMRRLLHDELGPSLTRVVEDQTGRRVRLCLGQVDVDADLAVEFFCLEPGPAAPRV